MVKCLQYPYIFYFFFDLPLFVYFLPLFLHILFIRLPWISRICLCRHSHISSILPLLVLRDFFDFSPHLLRLWACLDVPPSAHATALTHLSPTSARLFLLAARSAVPPPRLWLDLTVRSLVIHRSSTLTRLRPAHYSVHNSALEPLPHLLCFT